MVSYFSGGKDLHFRWGDQHRREQEDKEDVQLLGQDPEFTHHVLGGFESLRARSQLSSGGAALRRGNSSGLDKESQRLRVIPPLKKIVIHSEYYSIIQRSVERRLRCIM